MQLQLSRLLVLPVAIFLLTATPLSWSQAHETQVGSYTLRTSTVSSEQLSASTARKHGIERSPLRGVLNVTIAKGKETVPANVEVIARNLTGHIRPIVMKEAIADGYVSYTGAYDFTHGEVLDFTIHAQPQGSKESLSLTFRDRMWGRGDLPDPQSAL